MISLQRSMHSSQMYTPGPAMSFLTCFCDFPQNEHLRSSPPSPNLATVAAPSSRSWASAGPDGPSLVCQLPRGDDLIDDAVVPRLGRFHYEVTVGVLVDLLDGLTGVVGQDLVEEIAHAQDLLGLDLDVGGLPGAAPPRLVQQHSGVRQRQALALLARGQQHRGGRRGLPE